MQHNPQSKVANFFVKYQIRQLLKKYASFKQSGLDWI